MFDKDGLIDIVSFLKEEYDYHYVGLKDLYKQDFIELEGNGVDALFWLKYRDDKYLFKPINNFNYNVWGEILSEAVAKDLGFPCAEYRIAKLNEKIGVLSKSFLKDGDRLIMGSQIIQEYLRRDYDTITKHRIDKILSGKFINHYEKMKLVFKSLNNYTDVLKIINANKILSEDEKNKIDKSMKDRLFFDILTMQGDRHTNNWGIIKTNNGYKESILYDNATSFGLNHPRVEYLMSDFKEEYFNYRFHNDINRLRHYTDIPLSFTYSERIDNKSSRLVLEEFLNNLDKDDINRYFEMIDRYSVDYIDDLIMYIEDKNGIVMDNELRLYILNLFEVNIKDLKNVFVKKVEIDGRTR